MNNDIQSDADLKTMIADYMEKGFLDNIIDMYKHDPELYNLIGDLIQDERMRVRVGVTALMEEMKKTDNAHIRKAVPPLLRLLSHKEPVVRGDAVNLLGIIGEKTSLPHLEQALSDNNPEVQLLAREAIEDIFQQDQ
jgi:HEAT repeat protein